MLRGFLPPPQAFIAVTMQVPLLRSGVNSLPKKGAELELELSLQRPCRCRHYAQEFFTPSPSFHCSDHVGATAALRGEFLSKRGVELELELSLQRPCRCRHYAQEFFTPSPSLHCSDHAGATAALRGEFLASLHVSHRVSPEPNGFYTLG